MDKYHKKKAIVVVSKQSPNVSWVGESVTKMRTHPVKEQMQNTRNQLAGRGWPFFSSLFSLNNNQTQHTPLILGPLLWTVFLLDQPVRDGILNLYL